MEMDITCQDLIPEPLPHRAIHVQRRQHAGADAEEYHARNDDGVVVADVGDQPPGDHGADHDGEEQRDELDAGVDGRVTLDGLEVEGCESQLVSTGESPICAALHRRGKARQG